MQNAWCGFLQLHAQHRPAHKGMSNYGMNIMTGGDNDCQEYYGQITKVGVDLNILLGI